MINITNVGTPNISENRKDRLHLKGEKSNEINIHPGANAKPCIYFPKILLSLCSMKMSCNECFKIIKMSLSSWKICQNVVSYICSFSHWHIFYKPCLNPMHCINQHNKSKHWANIDMAEKVLMMLLVKFCNFLALFSTYYLLLPWCNVLWRPILPAERELKLLNFQNREQNKCDKQHREILTFWGWDFKGVKIIVWGNSHFDGSRWNAREWPFKQKPLSISCTWYCL